MCMCVSVQLYLYVCDVHKCMCVLEYVCVCVCVREREREIERENVNYYPQMKFRWNLTCPGTITLYTCIPQVNLPTQLLVPGKQPSDPLHQCSSLTAARDFFLCVCVCVCVCVSECVCVFMHNIGSIYLITLLVNKMSTKSRYFLPPVGFNGLSILACSSRTAFLFLIT